MPANAQRKPKAAAGARTPRKAIGKPRKAIGKPRKAPANPRKRVSKPAAARTATPSGATDWRPAAIDRVRALIRQADPDAVEDVKWRKPSNGMQGVATWSHDGLICTGETYKDKVKFTFAKGASLEDPTGLFNADDRGSTRRAIDLREGQALDADGFKRLVRAAVEQNRARQAV